jgi:hypothetical protein
MDNQITQPLKTGVQFASEILLPGGSNFIKGDLVTGGIHAMLGLAARAMFGFPGMLIVSANSFSKATTGRNLIEALSETMATSQPAPAAPSRG